MTWLDEERETTSSPSTDEYGGSFENRMRYPLECLRAIRANIPADMPVLIRVSAHDDFLPGGIPIEEMIEFLKHAQEAGADAVDVSRGNVVTPAVIYEVPPIDIPRGFNVHNAELIRKGTGLVTIGSRSVDHGAIDAACRRLGIPCYVVGDAKKARRAIDATAEAAEAVLSL